MEYGKIISISGMNGLYELVGSKKDGAVVRSLEDKVTKFVSNRIHNFSHLESIEVYTTDENANLVEVLNAMVDSKEKLPAEKDAAGIKAFFQKVFPQMDFERVYASDMKKMVKWLPLLTSNNVELKLSEEELEEEEPEVEVKEKPAKKSKAEEKEVKAEPKATKAAAVKETKEEKPAPKKAAKEDKAEVADKPVKKAAPKKKAAAKKKTEE